MLLEKCFWKVVNNHFFFIHLFTNHLQIIKMSTHLRRLNEQCSSPHFSLLKRNWKANGISVITALQEVASSIIRLRGALSS